MAQNVPVLAAIV